MFINEMANGSEVSLDVKNKEGKEITLTTKIVGSYDAGDYKMSLVEALRHDGQLLVFDSVICTAYIVNADDGKLYKYRLQAVAKREYEGTVYHCLICSDNVSEENRRSAKRFGLGARGSLQVVGGTTGMRGYVHDISATGISFLVPKGSVVIGETVKINFTHDITGFNIGVVAQVVRTEEKDKGTLYGCVVHKHDAKYTQLIAYLMRQECKVRK